MGIAIGLASACNKGQSGEDQAEEDRACAPRIAAFEANLSKLRAATDAIRADPLSIRERAWMSEQTSVSVAHARAIKPIPRTALAVEVTAERVIVIGNELPPYADALDETLDTLRRHFGIAACNDDPAFDTFEEVVLVAHPDAPWHVVQRIIQTADEAGLSRILLGFTMSSGLPEPTLEQRQVALNLDPQRDFADCPGLAAALASSGRASGEPMHAALARALDACACAVDPERVLTFLYEFNSLPTRKGQIPIALALSFVGPAATADSRRRVIAADAKAPWSTAHKPLLDAIAADGAFITTDTGVELSAERLAVQFERGPAYCARLAESDAARSGQRALEAGLIGALKLQQASARAAMTGKTRPIVHTTKPTTSSGRDDGVIQRHMQRHLPRIKHCYESYLVKHPGAGGKVVATFAIGPSGKVSSASATGMDAEVSMCVAKAIEAIAFPEPEGKNSVDVTYPFLFKPANE